jgi:hypothetical protein
LVGSAVSEVIVVEAKERKSFFFLKACTHIHNTSYSHNINKKRKEKGCERKKKSEGNIYTRLLEPGNKGTGKKRVFVDINYFFAYSRF